jgi:hypothetical protein
MMSREMTGAEHKLNEQPGYIMLLLLAIQLTLCELYFTLNAYRVDINTEEYKVQQIKNLVSNVLTAVAKMLKILNGMYYNQPQFTILSTAQKCHLLDKKISAGG